MIPVNISFVVLSMVAYMLVLLSVHTVRGSCVSGMTCNGKPVQLRYDEYLLLSQYPSCIIWKKGLVAYIGSG